MRDRRAKLIPGISLAMLNAVSLLAACAKDKPVEYPTSPAPAATTADPAPAPTPSATVDAPPVAAPLDAAALAMLTATLEQRAKSEARGMQKVDEVFGATLQPGQSTSKDVLITAKKCFKVLAQGGPGVTRVDIRIDVKAGGASLPLGQFAVSNTTGAAAAIEPCVENVFPLTMTGSVVVSVSGGSGPVAAQIFVK